MPLFTTLMTSRSGQSSGKHHMMWWSTLQVKPRPDNGLAEELFETALPWQTAFSASGPPWMAAAKTPHCQLAMSCKTVCGVMHQRVSRECVRAFKQPARTLPYLRRLGVKANFSLRQNYPNIQRQSCVRRHQGLGPRAVYYFSAS